MGGEIIANTGIIKTEMFHDELLGVTTIHNTQNVAPIIEDVKRRSDHAKGKDLFYVGSIPLVEYYKIQRIARGDKDLESNLMKAYFHDNSKFSSGVRL